MPTTQDVSEIVRKVQALLKQAEKRGVYLKVEGHRLDDDWLYIVIIPAKGGTRALEHATLMSEIERSLRADGIDQVLLVPAIED